MQAFTLLWLVASCGGALADVEFTSPGAGETVTAGSSFSVEWKDSGNAPSISDLTSYTLALFSGSNASPVQLYSLSTGTLGKKNSIQVTVPPGISGEADDAYFIGMLSVAAAGGTIENFSDRFTISGMTGIFPDLVKAGLEDVSGTSGPKRVNNVAAALAAAGGAGPEAFEVPFTDQTGLTRYAPMQSIPPTKIIATNTKPLFPTSSVDIASEALDIPTIQTTITQPQTFSVASRANTAAPASQPTNDMQKFLNRWKD